MTASNRPKQLPAAIVLGGSHNALSIARSLGACGVKVYGLNLPHADVMRSRFADPVRLPGRQPFSREAAEFLTGSAANDLEGSVLLGASDEALEILIGNREALLKRFRLEPLQHSHRGCHGQLVCQCVSATTVQSTPPC